MEYLNSVVGSFADHTAAEAAVKQLAGSGLPLKIISIVGKGYHTDEKVVGFYNTGDRVRFWGLRGAFWGGLWGMLFGGVFLTLPVTGPVVVVGYLAASVISALETAAVAGGVSALAAAFYSVGIPRDSVVQYEAELQADAFLVIVHGDGAEVAKARDILGSVGAARVERHGVPADAAISI